MAKRMIRTETWTKKEFTLTNAVQAEQGKLACIDTATGLVTKGGASTTLVPIGHFAEDVLGDGTKKVNVRLFEEIEGAWWDNSAGDAVAAADVGSDVFIEDDVTVAATDGVGTLSVAGRCLAVDAVKGVFVVAPRL